MEITPQEGRMHSKQQHSISITYWPQFTAYAHIYDSFFALHISVVYQNVIEVCRKNKTLDSDSNLYTFN